MAFADPEREREWRREYNARHRDHINERRRQWRRANPEKRREEYIRSRARNRDKELERKRIFREQNRDKLNEDARQWRAANRERSKEVQRQFRLRNIERVKLAGMVRNHGVLYPVIFAEMWTAQDGRCYLCRDQFEGPRPQMDHDHRCCPNDASCSRCRRGLACRSCNTLIGLALDDPDRLRLIADNLESALTMVAERIAGRPEQLTIDMSKFAPTVKAIPAPALREEAS